MPIDGVYFSSCKIGEYFFGATSVCFFYQNFSKFVKRLNCPELLDAPFIATIHTEMDQVHKHDMGRVAENSMTVTYRHWNGLDCDYVQLFAFGKLKMLDFWAKY